jgi:hypothetical protein
MPVVRTANTKRPSKAASRVATARHQRRGVVGRLGRIADVVAVDLVLLMSSHYASRRGEGYPNFAAKSEAAQSRLVDAIE